MAIDLLNQLKSYFQHDAFLEGQEKVIKRIINGDDLCVVMPTGAGKSLCYQLPALLLEQFSLVISPLISLMKDQVDALRQKGIKAAFLNSTLSLSQQQSVISEVISGNIQLLYVAPERLRASSFRQLIQQVQPAFLVIDEAHCISQWGHDFRPDYMKIGLFVKEWRIKQICAFTATATPLVRDDIVKQLHRELKVFVTGFTRPNLAFSVINCYRKREKFNTIRQLLQPPVPTIIYAATRKNVDAIAENLTCIPYHAGMSDEERTKAQNRFMTDECPIVAATNAFGMGIDRPDIRQVIHFNIPGSLEAYYQEAGRAGRDGEDAKCILLFTEQDKYTHEFLIEMNNPPEFVVHSAYQTLLQIAEETGNNHLEISVSQLTSMVPGAKGDQQISASLKILEKNNYLVRGYRNQNRGFLRSNKSLEELSDYCSQTTTQRTVFISRILARYDCRFEEGIPCNYGDLAAVTGLSGDRVQRVIRALNGREIVWIPPFTGRSLTLTQPDVKIPDIDFNEQEHKIALEKKRLEDMLLYPRTHGCRQKFIIDYFGQENDNWQCRVCDICKTRDHADKRLPTADEIEIISTLLHGVVELSGRFGKNRICQFMTGSRSKDILKANLHRYPSYGLLADKEQPYMLKLLDSLLTAGCVKVVGDNQYPRIQITVLGRSVMLKEKSVPLEFHSFQHDHSVSLKSSDNLRKKRHVDQRTSKGDGEDRFIPEAGMDDLYERLRSLRNQMAVARKLIPYQIVNNRTLKELAQKAPLTVEEAKTIHGIGPKTEKTTLPKFIQEIILWREENVMTN